MTEDVPAGSPSETLGLFTCPHLLSIFPLLQFEPLRMFSLVNLVLPGPTRAVQSSSPPSTTRPFGE